MIVFLSKIEDYMSFGITATNLGAVQFAGRQTLLSCHEPVNTEVFHRSSTWIYNTTFMIF